MCDLLDDGSAYLRVDYSVQCYSEDGAYDEDYLSMMIWAGVMAVIYPIGTPLLFAAVLYANREAIAKAEKLECDLMTKCEAKLKMATDDDKRREVSEENAALIDEVEQQIRSTNLKGGCLKLTNGYELRCSWFEVFECGRKICLVGIPVFVDNGSASQLIMGLLVCFISAMMYASYEPFVSESDDRLSKSALPNSNATTSSSPVTHTSAPVAHSMPDLAFLLARVVDCAQDGARQLAGSSRRAAAYHARGAAGACLPSVGP